jgi:hypothetical protein
MNHYLLSLKNFVSEEPVLKHRHPTQKKKQIVYSQKEPIGIKKILRG